MTNPNATNDDDAIKVDDNDRAAAHGALDRWLDDCQREGAASFDSGRSGYIGRLKLWAFVDDNGVSLRLDRSLLVDL